MASEPHALPTLRRRKWVILVLTCLCAAFWWQAFKLRDWMIEWVYGHVEAITAGCFLLISFALMAASLERLQIRVRPVDEDTLRRFGRGSR